MGGLNIFGLGGPDTGGLQRAAEGQMAVGDDLRGILNSSQRNYEPMNLDYLQGLRDIIQGRSSNLSGSILNPRIASINADSQAAADRINQNFSGFGRSSNPMAAKMLSLNELARYSNISNARNSMVNNAMSDYEAGVNNSLNRGVSAGGAASAAYGGASGSYGRLAEAQNAGTQNLMNLIGGGLSAYGGYAALRGLTGNPYAPGGSKVVNNDAFSTMG